MTWLWTWTWTRGGAWTSRGLRDSLRCFWWRVEGSLRACPSFPFPLVCFARLCCALLLQSPALSFTPCSSSRPFALLEGRQRTLTGWTSAWGLNGLTTVPNQRIMARKETGGASTVSERGPAGQFVWCSLSAGCSITPVQNQPLTHHQAFRNSFCHPRRLFHGCSHRQRRFMTGRCDVMAMATAAM